MKDLLLKKKLSEHLKIDLELVINENRSTMLNLLEKRSGKARLSIHKMFLDAPENVIAAIAHYVRGARKDRYMHNLILRGYIQQNLARFDSSHRLNRAKLVQSGRIYHLEPLYQQLNECYFEGNLDLAITWFGERGRKNKSRITFGLYHDNLKLIKIHRILDDPFFPDYFVSFVIYHEMLHAIVPGSIGPRGRYCIHTKAFKEKERLFEHYEKAVAWEKKNKKQFFYRGGSR